MNQFISQATSTIYNSVVKPFFFRLEPEFVHDQNVIAGQILGKVPPFRALVKWAWGCEDPRLQKKIDGIVFPNPIGLSAGFDYNGNLTSILPAVGFGFHTIGTVTLNPYEGNAAPRLGRFPKSKALLVNKGLKNDGAQVIINRLKNIAFSIPTGISIASTNKLFRSETEQIKDITDCFQLFESSSVKHSYYELNISCPNTFGGEPFTSSARLESLMKHIDKIKLSKPLYVKMPIDQRPSETKKMLDVLNSHSVQGVIFGNLTKDHSNPAVHAVDKKLWQTRKGNLSGKPTWERSNECVQLTRKKFGSRFTIIGTGGIFNGQNARIKMELGADLVQLITGMIYEGPQMIGQMNKYLVDKIERY